jgi:hypothetical protein
MIKTKHAKFILFENNFTFLILSMIIALSETNPIFCFWNQFNVYTLFYGKEI